MIEIITVVILVAPMLIFGAGMVVGGKWMKRIMKKKFFIKLYGG